MKNNDKLIEKTKLPFYKVLSTLVLISSLAYFTYALINVDNIITNIKYLSTPLFILIISIFIFIISIKGSRKKNLQIIFSLILITFTLFNFMNDINVIILPQEEKMISYVNLPYKTLSEWTEKNKIQLITEYEYSDTIDEGNIIRIDISEGTPVKEIKKITAVISEGPDYDKLIIVPSMIGWNIDDVVKFIKDNHIIGVSIEYELSDEEKDTIIKQDKNGDIRRAQEWTLTASLGTEADLPENIEMIDLVNMSLFDSTLWLKRNNIKYTLEYNFDNKIKRNNVINQNINKGETIDISEKEVILTISKGKAIDVPDLLKMSVEEITNWIIDNKLKISFEEIYDEKIETGKVIDSSVKLKDKVEIGTLITITISKGQIKMQNFESLYEFKTWANKYNIAYSESYEYSNSVGKGYVISYSYSENEIIDPDGIIYVKVSLGKAVTIPSFIGKTKNDATSICNNIGIKCNFVTGTYTDYNSNVVYDQSKGNGTKVTSGSTITLTLSKGVPTTKRLFIQPNWLVLGDADSTIESLKKQFSNNFPGVTFVFEKRSDNTLQKGMIPKNSPTNDGSSVKQGNTYTIYIVGN